MGQGARRWLAGVGTAAAVGVSVLGQAGVAGAVSAGPAAAGLASIRTAVSGKAPPGSVYTPTGQTLVRGMRGPAVKALQQRLSFLHYFVGKINGHFGWDTQEGVWAFKEVQSGKMIPPNPNMVGPAMQRELVHPRLPKMFEPRSGWKRRIEINLKLEVLVLYHHNKVELISHVSSAAYCRPDGCGFVTPPGEYRAQLFLKGAVRDNSFGGHMYNPVFFIGTEFAIHGMPYPTRTISFHGVPLNPASHGCVRIPYDLSLYFHTLIHVSRTDGTPIWIVPLHYGRSPDARTQPGGP